MMPLIIFDMDYTVGDPFDGTKRTRGSNADLTKESVRSGSRPDLTGESVQSLSDQVRPSPAVDSTRESLRAGTVGGSVTTATASTEAVGGGRRRESIGRATSAAVAAINFGINGGGWQDQAKPAREPRGGQEAAPREKQSGAPKSFKSGG